MSTREIYWLILIAAIASGLGLLAAYHRDAMVLSWSVVGLSAIALASIAYLGSRSDT